MKALRALALALALLAPLLAARADEPAADDHAAFLAQWRRTLRLARDLTERGDEQRPEDQLTLRLFDRPLVIGGEIETELRLRTNFRLDPARRDDEVRSESKIELELFHPLTRSLFLFLEGKLGYAADLYSRVGPAEHEWKLQRGQTWLHWYDVAESGVSLRVGRQNFQDEREWWWDYDLDGLRLFYEWGDVEAEIGVARDLFPYQANHEHIDPDLDQVTFVLGKASWFWGKDDELALFFARRLDDSPEQTAVNERIKEFREDTLDADLTWGGIRALGRLRSDRFGRLDYWADTAVVGGHESRTVFRSDRTSRDLRRVRTHERRGVLGFGVDVGATWTPPIPALPRLTLGYAWGSGDGGGSQDGAFRQTGLQDNNDKFRGVSSFKFYGELFRPDLSNMHVFTAAIGVPFASKSSVELLYHRYLQDTASAFVRDTRIKAQPTGLARDLGQEVDLVISIEEWKHWEIEAIGSWFRAGEAWAKAGEDAGLGLLKINYNF